VVAEWGNGEIRDWREGGRERDVWEGSWGERSGWGGWRGLGGGRVGILIGKGIKEWVYACRASERVGVCGGYFISWSGSEVETTARFFTSGFKVIQITSEVLI